MPQKGFIKVFKAFIKPFETPQRSVKIKFKSIFSFCLGLGREGLNTRGRIESYANIFRKCIQFSQKQHYFPPALPTSVHAGALRPLQSPAPLQAASGAKRVNKLIYMLLI